jgi:hypothetical protein
MYAMECTSCDALLADYKSRVGLFTNAERRFEERSELIFSWR